MKTIINTESHILCGRLSEIKKCSNRGLPTYRMLKSVKQLMCTVPVNFGPEPVNTTPKQLYTVTVLPTSQSTTVALSCIHTYWPDTPHIQEKLHIASGLSVRIEGFSSGATGMTRVVCCDPILMRVNKKKSKLYQLQMTNNYLYISSSLSVYTPGHSSCYLLPAQKIIRLHDVFTSYVYKTYYPKSVPL